MKLFFIGYEKISLDFHGYFIAKKSMKTFHRVVPRNYESFTFHGFEEILNGKFIPRKFSSGSGFSWWLHNNIEYNRITLMK